LIDEDASFIRHVRQTENNNAIDLPILKWETEEI